MLKKIIVLGVILMMTGCGQFTVGEGMSTFQKELQSLINRFSKESESHTPDFILSQYILDCLNAYSNAVKIRDSWFQFEPFKKHKDLEINPKEEV